MNTIETALLAREAAYEAAYEAYNAALFEKAEASGRTCTVASDHEGLHEPFFAALRAADAAFAEALATLGAEALALRRDLGDVLTYYRQSWILRIPGPA